MKNKRGGEIINIYTPALWIKLTLALVSVIMLGFHFPVMLWTSQTVEEFPVIIFVFLLPLYTWLLWYTIIIWTQTRLIVYEDGIEIQRGASSFFSPWENMRHFGLYSYAQKNRYGIFLHEKVQPEAQGLVEKLFYGWSSNFIMLNEFVYVPWRWVGFFQGYTVDVSKLRDTEFGRQLLQYAPHLFEYGKEKQKNG
jgi:hypothetical protein